VRGPILTTTYRDCGLASPSAFWRLSPGNQLPDDCTGVAISRSSSCGLTLRIDGCSLARIWSAPGYLGGTVFDQHMNMCRSSGGVTVTARVHRIVR